MWWLQCVVDTERSDESGAQERRAKKVRTRQADGMPQSRGQHQTDIDSRKVAFFS